jgi:hypothetical protein
MVGRLRPLCCLELVDELADLLRASARHDHDRIGRVDDHQVLDTDHRGQALVGMHHAII